jgi:hypothetical protein
VEDDGALIARIDSGGVDFDIGSCGAESDGCVDDRSGDGGLEACCVGEGNG